METGSLISASFSDGYLAQGADAELYPWYGVGRGRTMKTWRQWSWKARVTRLICRYILCGEGVPDNSMVKSERPLFPGYMFCRFDAKKRLPILMTTGVISVVSFGKEPGHTFRTEGG